MIFLEFQWRNVAEVKHYFAGSTLQDVIDDIHSFGDGFRLPCREVSIQEIVNLDLRSLRSGIRSIKQGRCKSFYLGIIRDR